MENKGCDVSYYFVTLGQFKEFRMVIKEEKNFSLKKEYQILFWSQIILIPLYLIGMIILIGFFA